MGEERIGDQPGTRPVMVAKINEAFSRRNIDDTAKKLGRRAATGDFLDICDAIDALAPLHGGDLPRYKRELSIPSANQTILTGAFRASLTARPKPIPLHLMIVSGTHDAVHVMSTASEIAVVVTRDDRRKTSRRRAPRKRSAQ
ncbi:MAG TPA: hypothetical protein VLI93_14815 [Acetobacteraceae bacterium]|nr:hypothetical protein [Acetobacteraceae bacterium]